MELLTAPMKRSDDVEVARPLRTCLRAAASTADAPEEFSAAAHQLHRLRQAAARSTDRTPQQLDHLYAYCDQLASLEEKVAAADVQIPFRWKDAFDRGSIFGGRASLTLSSLGFERACVLFNAAALQSALAAAKDHDDDEELKAAAKLFQQSAGIFKYLKENIQSIVHQDTTPDLQHDTLTALHYLMLAQAQEMFVLKAVKDDMKYPYVPYIANQCKEFYAIALKSLQKENVKMLIEKEWISIVQGKQLAYEALAYFHYSQHFKSQTSIGSEISALQYSVELFKNAQTARGRPSFFQDQAAKAQRVLNEVKKDNDLIYHDIIPDVKKLEPLGKIALANPLPMPEKWNPSGTDLFENLVPVPVHQALAAYDVRKSEIVTGEINKLRESTQLLNSTLASLNLPAAIEKTSGGELPQSIIDKADAIKEAGGVEGLLSLMRELPDLFQRNSEILNESERMLREEAEADKQLRTQFGAKWSRTSSDELTKLFVTNVSKYREIIQNAITADRVVREKYETHKEGMELLSKSLSELQSNVPSSGSANVKESSSVQSLRRLMENVETIKAERDVIESELKSATQDMKSKFLNALTQDGAISEPAISVTSLGEIYGPLQRQVAGSIEKQEQLIRDIQDAHRTFVSETGGGGDREQRLCQLAAAHDAFIGLLSNLKEGTKFYNDLTKLLLTFQNKISDYCFARKIEKDELLKDLTQETSRGGAGVGPAPTPPEHHHNLPPAEPRQAPPRPPQPATAPQPPSGGNLPYPQQGHGQMPVPYGAPSNAPYPAYQPPMPQGYNPYAGMPYPQSAAYSGFPQAPYMPQAMQYPPHTGAMPPGYMPPGGAYPQPQYPGAPPQYPPQYPQYPGAPPQQPPQW